MWELLVTLPKRGQQFCFPVLLAILPILWLLLSLCIITCSAMFPVVVLMNLLHQWKPRMRVPEVMVKQDFHFRACKKGKLSRVCGIGRNDKLIFFAKSIHQMHHLL